MRRRLSVLLEWTSASHIQIDGRIQLVDEPATGIRVLSTTEILPLSTLVTIPKSALLSCKSCSRASLIPFVPYGHGAHLALALAVYSELLNGSASRWYGYLQSLPTDIVPIALLWGTDDADEDGMQGRLWLTGTEVEKEFLDESGALILDESREYYATIVEPLLSSLSSSNTLSGFLHAYSLVSSRAFLVDAYHGLSMVPIADAFNHIHENHVHLESDYDVCPTCGSLSECPHDREESSGSPTQPSSSKVFPPSTDTCDMVTNLFVPAHSEVFNTYGARLSNATLLTRYGFSLEGNENDILSWNIYDLRSSLHPMNVDMYERLVSGWTRSRWSVVLEDSTLVFRPDLENDTYSQSGSNLRRFLCINSDAQVSVHLWLWAAFRNMRSSGAEQDLDEFVRLLGRVAEMQVQLEHVLADGGEDEGTVHDSDALSRRILSGIATDLCVLCAHRITQIGAHPELSSAELGEMLDNLPSNRPKTRLALSQVLAERAVVESCASAWRALEELLEDDLELAP
ncbi:hypothetical protein BKA93DRAFT_405485 [Sparassis latifolia]|uniref:SET domain-containing protein n=1 Tax=Sparassis crispa TaxID=139825 RepID=A0A401H5Q5_9APHY|nr:SET domain-containing protein [Sparassis crispa]GBE89776.1 SET domain-containing protein [Sparassis crispa]